MVQDLRDVMHAMRTRREAQREIVFGFEAVHLTG